jgi:uncharacterized membrane protein YesL
MEKWFDQDNVVMRSLSKIFDIGYLSVVWLLFSLPILTIGASFTALYYATVKVIRRERGYVFGEFWHSFRMNFIQATKVWIGILVLMILMVFNIQVVSQEGGNMGGYLVGVYIAIAIIVTMTTCYIFPILSRFEMKIRKLIRFSFYLSMRHILSTLLILVMTALGGAGFVVGFIFPQAIVLLFFIPVLCVLSSSYLLERIFKKYMPKQEERTTEEGETITDWYME